MGSVINDDAVCVSVVRVAKMQKIIGNIIRFDELNNIAEDARRWKMEAEPWTDPEFPVAVRTVFDLRSQRRKLDNFS